MIRVSLAGLLLASVANAASSNPNIVVISLEDIGAESQFAAPKFTDLLTESVYFTSHYSGYQSSASKSQLMTGIHAFHTGYGQIGEDFDFGHAMIGGVPLQHSLLSEYLKANNNGDSYKTYYVGSWGLGYSMEEQLPNSRGFDYFYGSYTSENDVLTKKSSYTPNKYVDPMKIVNDENEYFDFWENTKSIDESKAAVKDSNSQYAAKAETIIQGHNGAKSTGPFYLHVSMQGPTKYYENKQFRFARDIMSQCDQYSSKRQFMCQYTAHVDRNVGQIVNTIKESGQWENTLVLIVSNNGGSLSLGSCNYPLRGGKDSYFEGNLRSFAMVSGGVLPQSRRGLSLSGLVSNVDWAPTLLSFANMISHDTLSVASFDGLNQYNYIMNEDGKDSLGNRDHIMFHLSPWGHDNFKVYQEGATNVEREWGWTASSDSQITLNEIGMVFYDDDGKLWKYFVTEEYDDHENKNGLYSKNTKNENYNWCVMTGEGEHQVVSFTDVDFSDNVGVLSGLFELTSDVSEQNNLLTSIAYPEFMTLKNIVKEKADNYLNKKLNTHAWTLYNSAAFGKSCFYNRRNVLSFDKTFKATDWMPFLSSFDQYKDILHNECGLSTQHALYQLYSAELQSSKALRIDTGVSSSTYKMHESSRVDAAQQLQTESSVVTMASVRGLMSSFKFDKTEKYTTATMADDKHVYSSCVGLSDGFYYVQIDLDASMPVVKTECSNEYMIINYALDNNWQSYFLSFFQSHAKVASPFKTDTADWETWFLPDGGNTDYDYLVSPMCNSCNEESLYQTSGTSTTYWENAVNSYCATNARGQPAGDAKWQSYTCRESVYNHGTSKTDISSNNLLYATFVDEWIVTDLNGIDKDILLTQLAGRNEGNLGTCLTLKQPSDNEHFTTITECEKSDVGNGNVPTIGIKGEYCVCAKKSVTTRAEKRKITDTEVNTIDTMAAQVKEQKIQELEGNNDNEKDKIHYLYQTDFMDGTYRIQEAGTYVIMEDIVFDYNAPDYENNADYSANSVYTDDGDLYWYPKVSQKDEYPGAYKFHDPYLLGFFAGITIESDDVTIDLNGKTLQMDKHYFYQQPWWSHIEIGSQAFVPGEGPSHFGATPTYVKNVEIKNGVLGLTSHHCVHGTAPEASLLTNVVIKDVVCRDFITHGIQLNGFNGLRIDNVEIGPNANMQYLTVDYSQMRTLLPRFEYFADLYGDDETFTFAGKPSQEYIDEHDLGAQVSLSNDKDYTLREILDEMILQMDMAFDYVTERKTEDELFEEYGDEWLQAKRVFVFDYQGGIPYGGVIYGLYLNYPSSGISGFYRNTDKSYNVELNNVYIHDITHASFEAPYLLKDLRSLFALPISAKFWLGDEILTNFNDVGSSDNYVNEKMYYHGTIVYDWLVAFYNILKEDVSNVEATNLLYIGDVATDWVSGEATMTGQVLKNSFFVTCNGDPMFHSVKGIFGLRIANVENVHAKDVVIENLNELAPLGSDICGAYERSHDIQQQIPYLYGFTGNNLHGISILDSSVLFDNLNVNNLNSLTGNATGMSVYPRSRVKFDGDGNRFEKIIAGSQFLFNDIDLDSLSTSVASPNQLPRSCAIKTEDFNQAESSIVMESLHESVDGTYVKVGCMNGYVLCNDEHAGTNDEGWSNFANEIVHECSADDMNYLGQSTAELVFQQPTDTIIYKPKSTQEVLMKTTSQVFDKNDVMFSAFAASILLGSVVVFALIYFVVSYKNNFNELSAKMSGYETI